MGEPVRIRTLSGTPKQRFRWWRMAIQKQTETMPARQCYGGDSWGNILAGEKLLQGRSQFWVVSAGLGLIDANEQIPDYSATFSPQDPDSVGQDLQERAEWWRLLVEWRRETSGTGSISDLAKRNPNSVFVIALSASYLRIIKDDLVEARLALKCPNNFIIVSAGTREVAGLEGSIMPIGASFENLVGGARATLNSRMLRYIVQHFDFSSNRAPQIAATLKKTAKTLAPVKCFNRTRLDDDALVKLITKNLRMARPPSASALLRRLRQDGYACEQKRFHSLYDSVKFSLS